MLLSVDATPRGPSDLLLQSDCSQSLSFSVSVSPSVACPISYTKKIPNRNWLSRMEIMLMSSFNTLQKVFHFTDWGQEKKGGGGQYFYWLLVYKVHILTGKSKQNIEAIHLFSEAIIRPKTYNWKKHKHLKTSLAYSTVKADNINYQSMTLF